MSGRDHPPSARIRVCCQPRRHHLVTFGLPLPPAGPTAMWSDPTPAVRVLQPREGAGRVLWLLCLRCGRHDAVINLTEMRAQLLGMIGAHTPDLPAPVEDRYL